MDFLKRIANFFHQAYCRFSPEASSCVPPAAPATAAVEPADRFQTIPPLETRRLEEIVRESRPVEVGCYIRMERVRTLTPQQIESLLRPAN